MSKIKTKSHSVREELLSGQLLVPTPERVKHWIRQDPESDRFLVEEEADAFDVIRKSILKQLLRDPAMWIWQLINILLGCCRYVVSLVVAIPTFVVWATLLFANEATERVPPPDWLQDKVPGDYSSSLWLVGLQVIIVLSIVDFAFFQRRISGFKNLFQERAYRIARHIWDTE